MSQFLTAKDVAELLSCSLRKVREATKNNQIPHIRIGGLIRYNRDSILAMGLESE